MSPSSAQVLAYTEITKFYHYSLIRLFGEGSFNLPSLYSSKSTASTDSFPEKSNVCTFLHYHLKWHRSLTLHLDGSFLTCKFSNVHLFFKLFTSPLWQCETGSQRGN